jgi:membrane fusion protein (multidrug efflux system)
LFRRHFFLVAAIVVVALMVAAASIKLLSKPVGPGQGGGGAAAHGAGGGSRGGGPGGGRGATEVTAAVIAPRTFVDRLEVLGVAKGRESVTLTSNASEMIQSVHFRPGQAVTRGQILVQLKSNEEDADILEARADVDLAKANADRWAALGRRGFAPQATVEQYNSAYERSRATLAAAESRRGDRVIRAPFSGVVGLTDIAPGTLIAPGTAIATLDDISVIRVDFDIPDRYLPLIHEGQGITATTDAYPGEKYAGRIARLDTRIDERTRAIKARAEFPNPGGRLKPGMMIRVGIDRGQRTALAAPEPAVQFSGAGSFVLVIAKRGDGLVTQQRPVVTGLNQGGFVEIREGVEAGERVVADGLNRVQPNQAVRVAGERAPPAGPRGARPAASRP